MTALGAVPVLAAADGASKSSDTPSVQQTDQSSRKADQLQEVIVTAQKREERLQDVPVPVTVISADALLEANQVRLEDYYSSVPGFTIGAGGNAGNQLMLILRGISSGLFTNPTVGVTVDDVPFGGGYVSWAGNVVPDLDPSDLARVEVLRGPQGTLYGASSMGGLLKFVTVDPSTNSFSGRVQADVDSVHNGAEPGYGFRGALNVPLTDTLAVRASAFYRQDAGYIDNPVLHVNGVNEDHVDGGRISALWRPSDRFSLKLSALYQDTKADGISEVDVPTAGVPSTTGLGDLQQNYFPGCCAYDKQIQAYSANLAAKLGVVDLTSITGYNVNKYTTSLDFSAGLGALAQLFYPSVKGVGLGDYSSGSTYKFTQEVRAVIPIGQAFEWLVGGFYTNEDGPFRQNLPAVNSATGTAVGPFIFDNVGAKYKESAGFTDLTIHFSDRFSIQFGGRESHIEVIGEKVVEGGPLFGASLVTFPAIDDTANVFTYLVTPEFKFSSSLMAYARFASGYRPGALNSFNPDPLVPRAASPDKTQNYEIGLKADTLNHALSIDASLYYINWKDIQLGLGDPNNQLFYTGNGSRAKSEGAELSIEARPFVGFTISGWAAYDNAVLTQDMPPSSPDYGPAGSRLPLSARFSGKLSANQQFRLTSETNGFAGLQLSYVGDRLSSFVTPGTERPVYPAYAKVDLNVGVDHDSWRVNLYVNNVADKRGVLGGGATTTPAFAYYYIQPRTVGLSLIKSF
jgi:outer membrane receptor protein involved in Fe transport